MISSWSSCCVDADVEAANWLVVGRGIGTLGVCTLSFTAITRLDESKATTHDCATADLIDHLGINLLFELHTEVLKHPS